MAATEFNYDVAFSRNIGWVTEAEQQKLRSSRVAIAGAGGVGSNYALTVARLGIGKFRLADFDQFDVHNFNRQAGAFMSTLHQDKVQVMQRMVLDINPEAEVDVFAQGVDTDNVDAFLADVYVYIDSLDFFALDARKLVFLRCYEKNIPVVTAAPLGMGTALLCFMPGQMSFEQYFRFANRSREEQLILFLIGLSPAMLQTSYLVDKSRVDFQAQKGPSTPMSVNLCAGLAGTYVLKIILNRGPVLAAPYGLHFDAYRNKLVKTWRPFGNAGLWQRLMFSVAKKLVIK